MDTGFGGIGSNIKVGGAASRRFREGSGSSGSERRTEGRYRPTRRKAPNDAEGEVREPTRDDIAAMRPAADVLPPERAAVLPKRRGPKCAVPKEQVTLRLDADVPASFRATGRGWQTRIHRALENLVHHEKAS